MDRAELITEVGFGRDAGSLMGQTPVEVSDQRGGLRLPNGGAFFGCVTPSADVVVVDIEFPAQARVPTCKIDPIGGVGGVQFRAPRCRLRPFGAGQRTEG